MTLSTIIIMTILGAAHPYRVVKRNYVSLIDEFIILVVTDLLLFSSNPALDPESREYLGWAIVGILGISIIYSQGGLLIVSVRDGCRSLRIRRNKRAYMKRMKEIEEKKKVSLSQLKDN